MPSLDYQEPVIPSTHPSLPVDSGTLFSPRSQIAVLPVAAIVALAVEMHRITVDCNGGSSAMPGGNLGA
jgi:hypothetical protein